MNTDLAAVYPTGPQTADEAFPPICLRSHWDPTMLVRHVLPELLNPYEQPLDPRPSTKISTGYYSEGAGDAPIQVPTPENTRIQIPPALLMSERRPWTPYTGVPYLPPGGTAGRGVPFGAFDADAESDTQLLAYPLVRCPQGKFQPTEADVAAAQLQRPVPRSTAYPRGLYAPDMNNAALPPLGGPAGCREADDREAWNRSARTFFNPTRYDRTTNVPVHLRLSESRYALAPAGGTRLTS
jgi:hypothetical protein